MSESLNKLETDLTKTLGDEVSGFDFAILIPILIQVLMDMLGNCGGIERAKNLARKPNNWTTRYAMRKAVNQSLAESGQVLGKQSDRQTIQSGVLQTLATYSDEELDALLNESKNVINYDLI